MVLHLSDDNDIIIRQMQDHVRKHSAKRLYARPERPRVHGAVTATLGRRIVRGELKPGEILPTEAALVIELGVSRSAVREAVRVLTTKGLVSARARSGTSVREVRDWQLLDGELLSWARHGPLFDHLMAPLTEVRFIIEPEAARLAAERADYATLVRIETAVARMAATEEDVEAHLEADYAFHAAILSASGNVILDQFADVVRCVLLESFALTSHDQAARREGVAMHQAVFEAICNRNGGEAKRLMADLLTDTRRKLLGAVA
jgi:GntR family transcriptional regulator, galactonate operon transcriptional repressor